MRCKVLLVLLPLLTLGGCDPTLSAFLVPPQVWTGQVFEVVVLAGTDSQPGGVGATLQLPNGFTAEDATAAYGGGSGRGAIHFGRPLPSTQTAIAVEPGHFMLDFYGSDMNVIGLSGSGAGVELKVYVHAPPTTGAFTLKVVLWGTSGVVPAGVTSFAQITTAPHAQPITVVTNPVVPFYPQPIQLVAGVPVWTHGVALADIDGDGLDDLGCAVSAGYSAAGLPVGTCR
jgi:hypothetical protein